MRYTEKTHLIDSDFRSADAGHSDLLIRITSSRFSYAIIDQTKDQLKVLFEASFVGGPENLDEVFLNNYLPEFDFRRVKVALESANLTFIPTDLYSEEDIAQYAKFLQVAPSKLNISAFSDKQVTSVSSFSDEVTVLLSKRFPKYDLYNLSDPLIEASVKVCQGSGTSLVLNFNTHSFEAVVISGSRFSFYNAFHCKSIDDFNYYLLLILKQLPLVPESTKLLLSGQISHQDEKYKRIEKYFTNIEFADNLLIPASDLFKPVPIHHFFSLTGLNLCE